MDRLVLPKDKIHELINKLLPNYQIFAPVENDGITLFKPIKTVSEIILNFSNSTIPPKSLLFQQTETLFKFTYGKNVQIKSVDIPNKKTVIFGIRPCDAKSFILLDQVFSGDYEDPYFITKRKNIFLIGLSCIQPGVNCFCTSLNDNPTSSDNVDILLTDIGEKYFVEVKNQKGKQLIENIKNIFIHASEKDENKKKEVEKKSKDAIIRCIDIKDINNIIKRLDVIFDSPFWKNIATKCLGCGICTYLCPTCHCFDIHDETTLSQGARVRVWDSCMRSEYTLQASGYNPRPERMNRVRNRVYHKYNYYPKNYNMIACVGCGRCIDKCPVNIDIIDVITKTEEVKP